MLLPPPAFPESALVIDILKERAEARIPAWSDIVDFEEDFIPALLHWRERTSTSPSGRHLGLYKALATAYCNSSEEFSDLYDDDDPSMGWGLSRTRPNIFCVLYIISPRRRFNSDSTYDAGYMLLML
jgi:hypothetical protein